MRDGVEEGVVQVRENELLLEDGCGVPKKGGRTETASEVCEHEGGEAIGADSLIEKGFMEVKALSMEKMAF